MSGCTGAAAGQSAMEWLKGVRLSVHNQKALPDCCTEKQVSITHTAVDVAFLTNRLSCDLPIAAGPTRAIVDNCLPCFEGEK